MGVKGNNLTVKFKNGTTAVDHVSLQMEKGIYGLLGENGAGKTTLMRVLTTILKPAEGSVSLNGIEYCEKNYEKIQKKNRISSAGAEPVSGIFLWTFPGTGSYCFPPMWWKIWRQPAAIWRL